MPAKLKPNHMVVLRDLYECTANNETVATFKRIAGPDASPNDVRETRRVVRFLARRGYAEYSQAFDMDDGMACGSGYMITRAGTALVEAEQP